MIFEQLGNSECTRIESIPYGWEYCFGKFYEYSSVRRSTHHYKNKQPWNSYSKNRTTFRLELTR